MKNLEKILQKYSSLILAAIFTLALILRWWYLPQNAISFAYDQARDGFVVQEMLSGNLKILGPSVSGIPGLYHGVFYYYLIAPAYYFGHGNPVVVAYFLSFFSSLGVFVVYFLAKALAKSKIPAILASLFFAFSFEAGQYANLITNASLGVLFAPLAYLGLYLWMEKSWKHAAMLTGLALGLSIQSELALGYHLAPIAFWLFIYRERITKKDLVGFIASFLIAISSMILVELKFGFPGVKGIFYLLTGQDGIAAQRTLSDFLIIFFDQTSLTLGHTVFPLSIIVGGVLGFLMVCFSLRDKSLWSRFLATYIFAHIAGLPFGGGNMRHLMVGAVGGICVFIAIFIWKYFWRYKAAVLFAVIIILGANAYKTITQNINGQTIFPLQPDLVLSKELAVIDYTYRKASGEPFSISTLTSPLYVNTLWSYLYNWYGKEKYGYVPSWRGKDQIGQLGNNLEFPPSKNLKHFFIIEPAYGIPELYVGYALGEQESLSVLIEKKEFGELIVEERKIKNEK